jgi:hypothetical protein
MFLCIYGRKLLWFHFVGAEAQKVKVKLNALKATLDKKKLILYAHFDICDVTSFLFVMVMVCMN